MTRRLFSIKMRASRGEKHISGAERIVEAASLGRFTDALLERAMHHANGEPDFVNLKFEAVAPNNIIEFDALKVRTVEVASAADGLAEMSRLLGSLGVSNPEKAVTLLSNLSNMRGAAMLDADSFERLEPDCERGVRVTNLDDSESAQKGASCVKNHYAEAIVLATKVANAPGIVAELCISDDPDYVTGYIASKELGYVRITKLKEAGSPKGGRIFVFRGTPEEKLSTIDFLQKQCVLVRGIKPVAPAKHTSRVDHLKDELCELRGDHLFREMVAVHGEVGTHVSTDDGDKLMLASNNYLDLAFHPEVRQAAADAALRYGAGSSGARLVSGNLEPHRRLEEKLAEFKGCEKAMLFNTGYMANLGCIQALCTEDDTIFSDELNHASIIDGCRLSRARVVVYRHNDMADLENKLAANPGRGLIVSDAVFSMDGDVAPLPELLRLSRRAGLPLMLDEAHSTGVLGKRGHGICEFFGCDEKPEIMIGTLSKALGAEGGFVCGSRELIDFMRNKARSFIFSTALAPSACAAAQKSLEIIEREPERVAALHENVRFFSGELAGYGIKTQDTSSAIIPIVVGDEETALAASRKLFERGFFVSAIRFPTVKRRAARLRVALMATHTSEELTQAAQAIADVIG
ncbi:MAG: 8-amino-7-oxononanoate synthase [Victivallaceae bacterium]|nr:8-amino-7-oxononanoate synthase [Victivallaceae bacterium]